MNPQFPSLRNILIALGAIIIGFSLVFYLVDSSKMMSIVRGSSEAYNINVIPFSNDDHMYDSLPKSAFSYVSMIDAGSSGSRVHVYKYGRLGAMDGPLYLLPKHNSKKVKPGLSSFVGAATMAGESLIELIDFAKSEIPEDKWKDSPIWLKATAGLRLLEKQSSDEILESIRNFLADKSKSPFLFHPSYASVIPGNEEGAFGWLAYNYMKRLIGPKKAPVTIASQLEIVAPVTTFAVIEMGGASSQVTQAAPTKKDVNNIPPEYRYTININDETYVLYTHSYLGYGAEQGRESLNSKLVSTANKGKIIDPCLNVGYKKSDDVPRKQVYEGPLGKFNIEGSSKKDSCIKAIKPLFSKDNSTCKGNGPFSFNCTFQPNFVPTSPNLMIFENYYYVSSGLGVKPTTKSATKYPLITSPDHLSTAANTVCAANWTEVMTSYPKDQQPTDNNLKWCFSASFASSFLTDALNIKPNKKIVIQQDVDGDEIEWATGAAYKEVLDLAKQAEVQYGMHRR